MDSDSPEIEIIQGLCREYGATLLLDVAHDLGAMGDGGAGQLAVQSMLGKVDLVMGAFSKTFASNGGFVATHSEGVRQYIKVFGGPHIFSNALSPIQAAVVLETLRIVRSQEGDELRARLMENILMLRQALGVCGIQCIGDPSPIVPAPIGSEKVARTASGILFHRGVFANLVEFPAVGIGSARFRLQVMAGHTPEHILTGAQQVVEAIQEARTVFEQPEPAYAVVNQRVAVID
jgi:glycine C-acetyltransferase